MNKLNELKEKYMRKFNNDYFNWELENDWKVILENDKIKCVFWIWTTNQIKVLNKRLWNYWPFMLSDSRFILKDHWLTLNDFYKEFNKLLNNSEYKSVLMFYRWFQDESWNVINIEWDNPWIDYCHQKREYFYVDKSQWNDIDDYITKNIKQKRRSNYRKSLKDYWDESKYKTVIKYAENLDEIKEFEDFCFESFINEKFWNENYMKHKHNQMFYRFCFEEWYKVLLFKIYDEDKLIWCEYALEIDNTLYCLFWYEDTENYDWLWVYLILKEIEFMLKSNHLDLCDYWVDDCWYKTRIWMKQFETYFTYLTNKNYD